MKQVKNPSAIFLQYWVSLEDFLILSENSRFNVDYVGA